MSTKKHIFVVAHMIRGGGAETFLRGLLPKLVGIMLDTSFSCLVAESRKHHYEKIAGLSLITVQDTVLNSTIQRLQFDNFELTKIVKETQPDMIFSAAEVVAYSLTKLKKPILLVYHSTLQFYMKPDVDNSVLKLFYTRFMRDRIAKKSDMIVAVSHFERGEIGARYHSHRFKKSAVVYHGVNHECFYPLEKDETVKKRFPFKYILCISDFHKHKKLEEMLEIYHHMAEMEIEEHLVFVGREKNRDSFLRIKELIEKYELGEKVHIIDYIDNSELREAYLNCTFYWTHSRYESFGMTPLEAMACAKPVFAAWRESLPEIYGNSVMFYNPYTDDFKDIATQAAQYICDDVLRKEYALKGYEYSRQYTWDRAAEEYKKIIGYLLAAD